MSWPVYIAGAAALAGALPKLKARLELSKAKHPSLRGHSRIGALPRDAGAVLRIRRAAVLRSDDAPDEVADRRRAGFMRLAALYRRALRRERAR